MINTLKYAKILEDIGLSRQQAEAQVQMVVEIMENNLVTKQDFFELKNELKQDIFVLRSDMEKLEYRLTIKLGSIVTVAGAIFLTLAKLIKI